MTSQTDRFYVERCLRGNRDDFRHLVTRYQKPLLTDVRFRLRQARRDSAEDVAQEAFVRAYANLAKLKKPDSFFAWLLGIAYRILLEHADRDRREREGLARMEANADTAFHASDSWEGDAALETALTSLPDQYREVVLLRFYGDCSCAEVAARLGIPLGTVTKRLSRAYDEIRAALAAQAPR